MPTRVDRLQLNIDLKHLANAAALVGRDIVWVYAYTEAGCGYTKDSNRETYSKTFKHH
jgi:hypothetical protein